jgi:hypothetical protein
MVQLIVADFFDFTFLVVVTVAIAINCLDEQAVIHDYVRPLHLYIRVQ